MLFQQEILQNDRFAVPAHRDIVNVTGVQRQNQGKIGVGVEPFAVHLHDAVAGLQAVFAVHRGVVFKAGNHGNDGLLYGQADNDHQHHADEKIHRRTGGQNDEPLPPGRFVEGTGIVASAVLALHSAVAADGDAADGVQGFAHLLFPEGRPHEHGKFVDLNAGELGGGKMPQLMDENQDAEQ